MFVTCCHMQQQAKQKDVYDLAICFNTSWCLLHKSLWLFHHISRLYSKLHCDGCHCHWQKNSGITSHSYQYVPGRQHFHFSLLYFKDKCSRVTCVTLKCAKSARNSITQLCTACCNARTVQQCVHAVFFFLVACSDFPTPSDTHMYSSIAPAASVVKMVAVSYFETFVSTHRSTCVTSQNNFAIHSALRTSNITNLKFFVN
jgi:hypothetical protein